MQYKEGGRGRIREGGGSLGINDEWLTIGPLLYQQIPESRHYSEVRPVNYSEVRPVESRIYSKVSLVESRKVSQVIIIFSDSINCNYLWQLFYL